MMLPRMYLGEDRHDLRKVLVVRAQELPVPPASLFLISGMPWTAEASHLRHGHGLLTFRPWCRAARGRPLPRSDPPWWASSSAKLEQPAQGEAQTQQAMVIGIHPTVWAEQVRRRRYLGCVDAVAVKQAYFPQGGDGVVISRHALRLESVWVPYDSVQPWKGLCKIDIIRSLDVRLGFYNSTSGFGINLPRGVWRPTHQTRHRRQLHRQQPANGLGKLVFFFCRLDLFNNNNKKKKKRQKRKKKKTEEVCMLDVRPVGHLDHRRCTLLEGMADTCCNIWLTRRIMSHNNFCN